MVVSKDNINQHTYWLWQLYHSSITIIMHIGEYSQGVVLSLL